MGEYIKNINRWLGYKDSEWNKDRWKEYVEKMKINNRKYRIRQRERYFKIRFSKDLPIANILNSIMRFQDNGVKMVGVEETHDRVIVTFKKEKVKR